jgi:ubiquinone/menaquinone biosynthesis C-methylase UbiE
MVICRVSLPYMHVPSALAEMNRVLAPGGEVWLLLHGWKSVRRRLKDSLKRMDWKDLVYLGYIALNSAALYLDFQFRFPRKNRCESVQTASSIKLALRRAGFQPTAVHSSHFFTVTARKT